MKKKIKKQTHKITHTKVTKPLLPSKIVVISGTFFAVIMGVFIVFNKRTVAQSVQGVAIVKGMFAEATLSLPPIAGAIAYNIYYDQTSSVKFTHAVRQISGNMTSYTIQYLKKGVSYKYMVSAIGFDIHGNKKEIWFSPITQITNVQGM